MQPKTKKLSYLCNLEQSRYHLCLSYLATTQQKTHPTLLWPWKVLGHPEARLLLWISNSCPSLCFSRDLIGEGIANVLDPFRSGFARSLTMENFPALHMVSSLCLAPGFSGLNLIFCLCFQLNFKIWAIQRVFPRIPSMNFKSLRFLFFRGVCMFVNLFKLERSDYIRGEVSCFLCFYF